MPDYALMNQCLYEGRNNEVRDMTEAALAEGRPVQEVLNQGLVAGMNIVGEDFKRNILYVPEVMVAARAMKAGMAILKPLLMAVDSDVKLKGTVVLATVSGDLHDIGKNILGMMCEGSGFKVVDLGVDTKVEEYIAAVREHQADIIGMSALLTTTMHYMKDIIDGFKEAGLGHIRTAVGGAPVSQMFAEEIGADAYGENAPIAIELFTEMMSSDVRD
jgi:5-methyltetrahydrofolate--homocysteine methyltransferase